MLPERRAHHLLDVSRGLTQVGNVMRASELPMEADRPAPADPVSSRRAGPWLSCSAGRGARSDADWLVLGVTA
jgi:hypothetical protein